MRVQLKHFVLSLVCVFAAIGAWAQDAEDFFSLSLEELGKIEISTATGNRVSLDRAPATASVVTAAQIEAMGARSLNDVLRTIPGVHLSLSDINRLDTIISIRGIHTGFNPHVLLLINGTPVQSNALGGRPLLFRLPVTSIARVEVIRGPGSAIYGADAFSGVVNVITHDPSQARATNVGGRTGSFGVLDAWASAAGEMADWNLSLDVSYQSTDGDNNRRITRDLQSQIDDVFGTTASLAPGALATRHEVLDTHFAATRDNLKANLWTWFARDLGNGVGASQALDPKGSDDGNLYLADLAYESDQWVDDWVFGSKLSYLYYKLESKFTIFPSNAVLPISEDGNVNFASGQRFIAFPDGLIGQPTGTTRNAQLDFVSIYNGFEKHRWRFSVGAKHEALDTSEAKNFGPGVILEDTHGVVDGTLTNVSDTQFVYLRDTSRVVRFVSLQDEWQINENLELTAGLRYDSFSDFGETTNPRLALVWQNNSKLTTKLLYGSAFRAPSFSEQFFDNNPVSLGNPDLKPERVDTLELAFNYRPSENTQLNLSLFQYQAIDMIEFIPNDVAGSASRAENIRDQDGGGAELELNWLISSRLRFNSQFSWQNARDANSGHTTPDAPRRQFLLSSYWEFSDRRFMHLQYKQISGRERSDADPREPIENYGLLDLTLRFQKVVDNVDLAFAVRNVLDENAREPSGGAIAEDYPLESRSVWAELSYTFN